MQKNEMPPLMTVASFMWWGQMITFYYMLFYAYFPFAMLARDVHEVTKRYS